MNNFISALENFSRTAKPETSVTENGAIGYKSSGRALVDLNFMLSSMRNMDENEIWGKFLLAYNENPSLSLRWLFFARDCREGCGERRTFRIIFKRLCNENEAVAAKLLVLIPFYGRWDDLVDVYCSSVPTSVKYAALKVIRNQLNNDLDNAKHNKPVSIMAKWIPSAVTSSRATRIKAEILRCGLGFTPKQYRKTFASLRKYIDVTEQKMSASRWGDIDYEKVPSRATMNYKDAFLRHDCERYNEYLQNVKSGKQKINASVLYPYDIVHAYNWNDEVDQTLEEQWKALPDKVPANESTLVVVDGSGSMESRIGNSIVTCIDVARSLGIYFAEKLRGPYYNTFITFSSHPRYVHFADGLTLRSKLDVMANYDDCSNTDIEKVFDLVLDVAIRNNLKQEELPANILICSDMEFDNATYRGGWGWTEDVRGPVTQSLFDTIRQKYEHFGYKFPRLVFWNVCSRTGTIPVTTNDMGVALVSGFSPNVADMVMSSNLDPYDCLVEKLMGERYDPVYNALADKE